MDRNQSPHSRNDRFEDEELNYAHHFGGEPIQVFVGGLAPQVCNDLTKDNSRGSQQLLLDFWSAGRMSISSRQTLV